MLKSKRNTQELICIHVFFLQMHLYFIQIFGFYRHLNTFTTKLLIQNMGRKYMCHISHTFSKILVATSIFKIIFTLKSSRTSVPHVVFRFNACLSYTWSNIHTFHNCKKILPGFQRFVYKNITILRKIPGNKHILIFR